MSNLALLDLGVVLLQPEDPPFEHSQNFVLSQNVTLWGCNDVILGIFASCRVSNPSVYAYETADCELMWLMRYSVLCYPGNCWCGCLFSSIKFLIVNKVNLHRNHRTEVWDFFKICLLENRRYIYYSAKL